MSEENYPSEYSTWKNDDAALPYIDTFTQTSSVPLPMPSVPQPEQQKTSLTELDQIAAAYQLGRIQKELKYDVSTGMTAGITSCILGIICFIPIILLIINVGYFSGMFWTAFLGFGAFAYGINRITASFNNLGARALNFNLCYYLCSKGIMLTRGKKIQAIRWDQVKAIQKIPRADYPIIPLEYILYPLDESEPLVLEKVCIKIKRVRLQIEHEITRCLLPSSIKAHQAGQILNFGPINVTPQGLSWVEGEDLLSWEKLGSVNESRGFLVIREKGTLLLWARSDISTIINLCIFWPLLEEIRREQYARESALRKQSTLINPSLTYIPTQQSEWQEYE